MNATRRIAMVSMHTSPDEQPGRRDAGGMNVLQLELARHLALLGADVDLLTRAPGDPFVRPLAPGVTLRGLRAGARGEVDKAELASATDEFGEAVAALVGRGTPRYDLLHAHYWLSGLAVLPVALELGIPLVQSFHTLGAMKNRAPTAVRGREPQLRLRTEGYLAGQADAVVAVSSAEVASLIDDLHAPAGKVWVVPPGVDTRLFTPERAVHQRRVRARYGLPADAPLLVTAGRIQALKGQDLAIQALADARGRGAPAHLVVVGEPTPGATVFAEQLEHLAGQLGVERDVTFVGSLGREDLADLLAASSLALLPSHSETFGLVALEAAASGTPVIGDGATGMRDSIAHGESGVLMQSRAPEAWGEAIAGLLADADRLALLDVTARRHAERFTWANSATALLAVYDTLLRP